MTGRQRRSRAPLLLALATLGALVAGCTSGDGSQASPTTSPPATTPAPATAPVACDSPTASYAPDRPLPTPGQMPAGSTMATIQQRGRLVVGVSADTLLFGARNPFTGKIEGFDIDMLREVSRAIFGDPDRIEYRVITYAQRIPSLQEGSVDIVAHTMTINCARWEQIAFSTVYYDAGQKVLVRSDSPATGVGDLDGQKVCAPKGSTNIDTISKYPGIQVVGVDDITDCLVLFQQGGVDAITADDTVLAGFAAQDPYAKVVGDRFTDEPYGLGINRDHPDFVRFVNSVLERMRSDGTWQQLYDKWLGRFGPAPAPPPATYGRAP